MGRRQVVAVVVGALALGLLPQLTLGTASARPRPVDPAPSAASAGPARVHAAGTTVRVGSLDLVPCDVTDRALCGTLTRRWDPSGAVPGTLDVGFAFVPASDSKRRALGTEHWDVAMHPAVDPSEG